MKQTFSVTLCPVGRAHLNAIAVDYVIDFIKFHKLLFELYFFFSTLDRKNFLIDTYYMYFRTEGVILAKKNFGEADRILTIYTRDHGKITALAKGVRRPKSRKSGHVELGNWCKIFVAKGKNLDLLTEVELKKAFGVENFSQEKANKIYHLLELVNQLTAEKQKNPSVFILLVNFLKKISKDEDFNLISVSFKVKLLSNLGFFSARNITNIKVKKVLGIVEDGDYETIKQKINLSRNSYLKLLLFLDSMIESLIDTKLKTNRFLNGKFQT